MARRVVAGIADAGRDGLFRTLTAAITDPGYNRLLLTSYLSPGQGRYRGVGRACGVGRGLGVTLGVAPGVAVAVALGVGVGVGVTLAMGVGVGVGAAGTMAYA